MKTLLHLIPKLSRDVRLSLALAAASLAIYLGNFRTLGAGDTVPASLFPIVLLTEGRVFFNSYEQYYKDTRNLGNPVYFFLDTNRGTVSSYPLATGLIATPIYFVPVLWWKVVHKPTVEEWAKFADIMEKVAAAIITSISIIAFFYTCRALGAQSVTAFWLSAAFAFGSEAWSTSSQGLWMHGPGILFMLLSVFLALKQAEIPSTKLALLLGLSCGIAIAVRLNNVLFVGPLLGWILWKQPRRFLLTLVSTSGVVIALLAYNKAFYGNFTGMYSMTAFGTPLLKGLEGVLFSPARGLLVYFPLTLFAIVGLAKASREPTAQRTIYLTFAAFIAAGTMSVSKWGMWHGGFCYGPRLLAEIQPFLLLVSIPVCKSMFEEGRSKFGMFVFFILFAWSSATQFLGAYVPTNWNWFPQSVDQVPARLWDWGDNPMGRSFYWVERKVWGMWNAVPASPTEARSAAAAVSPGAK